MKHNSGSLKIEKLKLIEEEIWKHPTPEAFSSPEFSRFNTLASKINEIIESLEK